MPPVRVRMRQDALSCQLCRGRKLKCDRQRPSCSNCRSRGQQCEYKLDDKRSDSDTVASHMTRGSTAASPRPIEPVQDEHDLRAENRQIWAENRALAARLEKLEQRVSRDRALSVISTQEDFATPAAAVPPFPLRAIARGDPVDNDLNWLETAGSRSDDTTHRLPVYGCTLEQIWAEEDSERSQRYAISIPFHDVVVACLDAYAQHLDGFQHIIHIQSARSMIDHVYSQINTQAQSSLRPGALSFILGLCAHVSFHYTPGFHRGLDFFGDKAKALKCSSTWTEQALLVMAKSQDASSATLEAVQAAILLTFLLYASEGLSYRVRRMHAASITMARDLSLHSIDMPGLAVQNTTQADVVRTEMRRRVWWYLTSTDWLMSMVGGPQEGLYSIHPRQMNVRMPRHITAEDLEAKGAGFQRSLAEPTIMSYYIQRVKLSITCREVSDLLYSFSDTNLVDYNTVRLLDGKFERQLQDLPPFLRFDLPNARLRSEYGEAFDEPIGMQRMVVHFMINIRRCKLHLPYLIRFKSNPQFAFSRRAGLQAARTVFNIRRLVLGEDDSASAAHLRQGGMLQHIFFATLVLVMDLCVNREEHGYDRGQMAEVREALKMIEEGTNSSSVGKQYYDSLQAILEKHRVKLQHANQHSQHSTCARKGFDSTDDLSTPGAVDVGDGTALFRSTGQNHSSTPANFLGGPEPNGLGIDNPIWQDLLEQVPAWDVREWDAFMSDFDMSMT